jgi:hypothetical protein
LHESQEILDEMMTMDEEAAEIMKNIRKTP